MKKTTLVGGSKKNLTASTIVGKAKEEKCECGKPMSQCNCKGNMNGGCCGGGCCC